MKKFFLFFLALPIVAWAQTTPIDNIVITAGTPTPLSGLLKMNGASAGSAAVAGTDYAAATSGSAILKGNGAGGFSAAVAGTDYAAATSGSAILKGNGAGGFSAAVAGTDYLAPAAIGVTVQAFSSTLTTWAGKTPPSGTVLGTTDAQTLTNKTIAGASNTLTVRAASDITGQLPVANGGTASSTANTARVAINQGSVALTDASSITTDASTGNYFTVTIAGNRSLANPTNLVAGASYIWVITQGSGGSHTLTYGSNFKWPAGAAPTLSTAAGAVDIIGGVSNGTLVYANAVLNLE